MEKKHVKIRKSVLLMLCCLCVLLAAGTATVVFYAFRTQKTYGELAQLASAVNANYYTDVDEDAVMDGAMKGYVSGLDDPYSQYRTPEEYQTYLTDESGQMVGIGVTVTLTEENYLQVVSLTKDSPAEKAGIQADDIIQAVDGKDVAELGYQDAVQAVRGEPDTKVKLTIQRKTQTLEVEVTRANIEVVTASGQMLDGQIGYIRIDSFKDNTPEQFQAIYDKLIQDGAKALVFDLRDNGGGLVRSLEKVLDPLMPEGDIAVATYRDGTTRTLVTSDAGECDLPMAVLVNGNTASAAELFAASLHDFDKGKVIGMTTFGKGIMQNTQQLPNGGALTLTVAKYRTVRGECYHGVGITPDAEVEAGEEKVDYDNPNSKTDPQLAAAIQAVSEQ